MVATDSNFCKVSIIYNLIISPASCPTITVDPPTLPAGSEGVFYSEVITASGGTAPYVFFVTAGTLPPGLALDTDTGVVSGTPTTSGAYPVTITAVDATFCTGSTDYLMIISLVGCPNITITPTTLPNGQFGTPYSEFLTATGGVTPYNLVRLERDPSPWTDPGPGNR